MKSMPARRPSLRRNATSHQALLDYQITSLADLGSALAAYDPTHLISLVDPGDTPPPTPDRLPGRHLILHMHDLDLIDHGTRPGNPSFLHASTILDFARGWLDKPGTRALFQCTAGRRRSAAAALLCDLMIQVSHGLTPGDTMISDAWDRMLALRPVASPNRGLLALGDEQIGLGGALVRAAQGRPTILTLDADSFDPDDFR